MRTDLEIVDGKLVSPMDDQHTILKNRWWERILRSRKRYFFEHVGDGNLVSGIFSRQMLSCIKDDISYVSKWIVNILLQLRAYGPAIRSQYGVSYVNQFSKMVYLAFRLRVSPNNFRIFKLYKPDHWKCVNDYAYFHTQSQREFVETSCPDEIDLFLDKYQFYRFCRLHQVHTPNVLAVYQNGDQVYPDKLVNLPKQDLFVKNRCGQMGWGAKKFHHTKGAYLDKEGKKYENEDVLTYLSQYSTKNSAVILQNVEVNHRAWQPFTPGALATCRIVTAKSPADGSVLPLFAAFRMPLKNSDTDNFSGGGIISSVQIESGILGRILSIRPINGKFEFSHHPQTFQRVEGEKLPSWDAIVEFTLDLHSNVQSPFVGWDVCMTESGCCVMEGSLVWASGSYEIAYQKPLKETIYPVLFEQWTEKYSRYNA